jgi:glutamine synthetase
MMSQIVAGLAGIDSALDPGPPDDEPYAAARPLLPKTLPDALDADQATLKGRHFVPDRY